MQKAKELKDKIEKVKSKIKILDNYKKNYGRHYTLRIKYVSNETSLVNSFAINYCNGDEDKLDWKADIFSHKSKDGEYVCVGWNWRYCIPYNDKTAHLLGTTENYK